MDKDKELQEDILHLGREFKKLYKQIGVNPGGKISESTQKDTIIYAQPAFTRPEDEEFLYSTTVTIIRFG